MALAASRPTAAAVSLDFASPCYTRPLHRYSSCLPALMTVSLPATFSPTIANPSLQIPNRERKHYSIAALPMLSLAAHYEFIREMHYWTLDEPTLKNIYLVFSVIFCWGCCVFASMKDPFYDSDYYRNAGGDGTQNWMYILEEEEEAKAREELMREELRREFEEKVVELKELEDAEKEKEIV